MPLIDEMQAMLDQEPQKPVPVHVPIDLKNVVCPQCKKPFRLIWNDYSDMPETIKIRSCPSGGVYDVSISCPHCDYEEEL